ARLPKGQLGEDTAKLMGSFVFASVWQAATARAALPEAARRDCAVYIDEAHNVLNLSGSVGDMLAEARGYHLSLTLAHQNLTQLPRETQLALSANARNKSYFSCSPGWTRANRRWLGGSGVHSEDRDGVCAAEWHLEDQFGGRRPVEVYLGDQRLAQRLALLDRAGVDDLGHLVAQVDQVAVVRLLGVCV